MSESGSRPPLRPRTASHPRPRGAAVARLARAARTPGLSTRRAAAAGRGGGRGGAARRHAQVRRHADAAIAGQGPGQPAGGAVHARFQGARHGAARRRSAAERRVSARWRAKGRSSSPSKPPIAPPATRAWCRSPATPWPNRSKPISIQSEQLPTRVLLAATRRRGRRACWCSAFPARAASRRRSIRPRSKPRG